MKIFAPFVLITLLIDVFFGSWYSETFAGAVELMAFYLILGIWAHARGHVAMRLFSHSSPVVMFSGVMIATTVVCSLMTLVTGFVWLSIQHGFINKYIAAFYDFAYFGYEYIAVTLTALEVLSLLSKRMSPDGMGGRFSDVVSFVYSLSRVDASKRVEV